MNSIYKIILSLIILVFHQTTVFASDNHPRYITFINQVRGDECCDPGNLNNLTAQITALNNANFQATFTIRYDALNQQDFINIFKDSKHEIGALLEITPSLAKNAEVVYQGDDSSWYLAKYSMLLGYEVKDREKLIDEYMSKFKQSFGYYPQTTGAWMIDSYSLNYLHNKYGVTVHQLTRNQWGTDTYSIYEGPFHYPYYASQNWPILPGNSKVLIVRQTVSDPLYNYADYSASHTSQPNDYMQNKDFSYFEKLLTQSLNQNQNEYSFALLGLENSMEQIYQQEFLKQISWVHKFSKDNTSTNVVTANQLPNILNSDQINITVGNDLVSHQNTQAIYITTPNYQARLIRKNNRITISDFRLYNSSITHLTSKDSLPTKNAYWITPFLIDSSRTVPAKKAKTKSLSKIIKGFFNPTFPTFPIFNPYPDYKQDAIHGLQLPSIDKNGQISVSNNTISYQGHNQNIHIDFDLDSISINQPNAVTIIGDGDQNQPFASIPNITYNNNQLSWNDVFNINITSNQNQTNLEPSFETDSFEISSLSYTFFYPDLKNSNIDYQNSFSVAHNKIAIANQNPSRIFIYALDENKLPTLAKEIEVESSDETNSIKIHKPTKNTDSVWVDVFSDNSGAKNISIYIDGRLIDTKKVNFVPNCKTNTKSCLKNPKEAIMYIYYQLTNFI